MLDDKLAVQGERIIKRVISWFEKNVSVSGVKVGGDFDLNRSRPSSSNAAASKDANEGGRGYVFTDPVGTRFEGVNYGFDDLVNPSVGPFPPDGVGVREYVGSVANFYRPSDTSSAHSRDCDFGVTSNNNVYKEAVDVIGEEAVDVAHNSKERELGKKTAVQIDGEEGDSKDDAPVIVVHPERSSAFSSYAGFPYKTGGLE